MGAALGGVRGQPGSDGGGPLVASKSCCPLTSCSEKTTEVGVLGRWEVPLLLSDDELRCWQERKQPAGEFHAWRLCLGNVTPARASAWLSGSERDASGPGQAHAGQDCFPNVLHRPSSRIWRAGALPGPLGSSSLRPLPWSSALSRGKPEALFSVFLAARRQWRRRVVAQPGIRALRRPPPPALTRLCWKPAPAGL